MKRLLWIIAALALLLAGAGWYFYHRSAAAAVTVTYTYVKAQPRDLRQIVTINGTITPVLSTEIRSEVSGRIARVLITAGDVVTVGQPLVELDQSTLKVQLDQVRLDIESSRLRSERARLDYERLSKLGEQKFVNTKELQDAEIAYKLSRTDAESQQARVRLLENSFGKATIVAPYAGTVLNVAARPGMVVTGADAGREGVALFEVADLSQLRVEATINEIDVASLSINQPVEVTFESVREARATGRVSFVSPAAKSGGGSSGGGGNSNNPNAAKEFPLQIAIETAHPRVKPGMTARVHIETAHVEKALSIEAGVIFYDFDKDESYVFVRPAKAAASGTSADTQAEPVKRIVTLGVRGKEHVEIKSGLVAGEAVSRQRPPTVRAAEAKADKKDK
ncbi:MAG: hypothetical protein RIQ79_1304 [Verrucomicrobiota bacterium]|jgi:RND family efflux transporter MFP subunit